MFSFLMLLIVFISVLLVLVIMSQDPKGGGLSSSFGGGGSQTFGVQRTNAFLDNATWTLAAAIAVLVFITSISMHKGGNAKETTAPAMEQTTPAIPETGDSDATGETPSDTADPSAPTN